MGKGNTFAASWLGLVFQGVAISGIAQNAASPLTQLWVALHTADPGAAGAQNTSEAAYGNYSRIGIVRTSSGWSLAGQTITPVASITFPTPSSGTETETFFSIGTASSGVGEILYSGPITPPISITVGIPPVLLTGTTIKES